MKKNIFLIFLIAISFPLNAQWVSIFEQRYMSINELQFANVNTGYAVGEDDTPGHYLLIKTTNGGVNWNKLFLDTNQIMLNVYDVSFVNENTGYICGYSSNIFKTTNGGNNWITLYPYYLGVSMSYNAIQFLNEQIGYAVGRYGTSMKTTNGGATWNWMDTSYKAVLPNNSFFGLCFLNANTGFMGDWNGYIFKTTNGGINWNFYQFSNYYSFDKIRFINDNTGYAAGQNSPTNSGAIYKTTNAGDNWVKILSHDAKIYSMNTVGESIIYAGGVFYYILKSTNAGISWIHQSIPVNTIQRSFCFLNQNTGFCGSSEHIFKTTNGGSTFISQLGEDIPNDYMLYQNYPNPFNPSTNIKFSVKKQGLINISLYDITGKKLKVLVNQQVQPGTYNTTFDAGSLPSSVYYCRMEINNKIQTIKLIITK